MQATTGLPTSELLVGDVYNCTVFRFFPASRPLSDIRDHDVLWMYHVPEAPGASEAKAARSAAAEEARKRSTYAYPHELKAENEVDVVICLTRMEVWWLTRALIAACGCVATAAVLASCTP